MHASQESMLGLSDVSIPRRTSMQDIVSDFPDYLDAYMRLACIERKQGNLKKAIEWAEKGVDRAEACSKGSSSHSDLLAMTGQFCGVCQCVSSAGGAGMHTCLFCASYLSSQAHALNTINFAFLR